MRHVDFVVAATLLLCVGCAPRSTSSSSSSSSGGAATTDAGQDAGALPSDAGGNPDAAQLPDASTTADAGVATDAGAGTDAGGGVSDGGLPPFAEGCNSFFAARVVEKQQETDTAFPPDCTAALTSNVGMLSPGGAALCTAGESANACRQRVYDTPPAVADLGQGCWNGSGPTGCLRGKYLPKCINGTDTGCAEPEAVCQDGTRPMVYAEAATTGPSNIWQIHMGGEGGPCTGASCWYNYRFARVVGDEAFERAMSTTHPDYITNGSSTGTGISNGNPNAANPFARYNRIRFKRCTDAASDATQTVLVADGIPAEYAYLYPQAPVATRLSTAPVWYKGFNTYKALFHSLTTPAGRDLDGDNTPDLPSLANATTVILSGSSDASAWVVLAADRLADEIRLIAGPTVDVRIMIDGYFEPGLDNEGRYHPSAPANFNLFANTYTTTGLCTLPDNGDGVANEACSQMFYQPGPTPSGGVTYRDGMDIRNVQRDASCEAMHGAGAWECSDKMHTLLQHVAVPFLVLADQEDNTISRGGPIYSEDHTYFWDLPATYRARVLDQANDVEANWSSAAREEAGGAIAPTLILPKARRNNQGWGQATHVRFHDNMEMASALTRCDAAGNPMGTVAFATMMGAWVDGTLPQSYAAEDAASWDGTTPYWVTGNTCRAPE